MNAHPTLGIYGGNGRCRVDVSKPYFAKIPAKAYLTIATEHEGNSSQAHTRALVATRIYFTGT